MIATRIDGGWLIECPACGMERHAQTALIVGRIRHAHTKECTPRKKRETNAPKPRPRASWDDREDSTWIDKL